MTEVEGKISIWIKEGSFSHASDLYMQVMIDDNDIWRTDDKDGFSPSWDSTVTKHIKGEFEKVILKLMDEDTSEFNIADLLDDGIHEDAIEMLDADGNAVGTVSVDIGFEAGDVDMFQLFGSMLHKSDD